MAKRLSVDHIKQHGHTTITPTIPLLRYWWRRFNDEVFGGVLLSCDLRVTSCAAHGAVGLMWPLPQLRARIDITPEPNIKAEILATLLHEMVHQYQHQHGEPLTHGEAFTRWRDPILGMTGLQI